MEVNDFEILVIDVPFVSLTCSNKNMKTWKNAGTDV